MLYHLTNIQWQLMMSPKSCEQRVIAKEDIAMHTNLILLFRPLCPSTLVIKLFCFEQVTVTLAIGQSSQPACSGVARPKLMVGPDYRGAKKVLEDFVLAAPG